MRSIFVFAFLFLPEARTDSAASNDPEALYALALTHDGLNSPDVKPWHLRAPYSVFDKDGNVSTSGVFEEWWVSPHKYKRSYTSAKFNHTDYSTDTGVYRQGDQDWPAAYAPLVRMDFIDPLPDISTLKDAQLETHATSSGSTTLNCISPKFPLSHGFFAGAPRSCLDMLNRALRIWYGIEGEETAMHVVMESTVVVHRTIGEDGHVSNVRAISGPHLLQQPTVDAVNQWLFRPFLADGGPREVESDIEIRFARR